VAERLRVKAKANCLYNSFAIKHTYSLYGDFLMETTTQTTQSLLEIWNADEGKENSHQGVYFPERIRLERQLGNLLTKELEAPNNRYNDSGYEKLLEEFRSNFEWDTQYNLSIDWELEPNTATQELENLPLEEVNAYLCGDKALELPDWGSCDIEYGRHFTGECSSTAEVEVRNLRPKVKKHQYAVQMLVECEQELRLFRKYMGELLESDMATKKIKVLSFTVA
jgi:hypothetical protein